ncbi:hypothetical protein Bca4012_085538 [Brassica carinata]
METKPGLVVFSIVMLHLLMSVQMHPIHSKSPAPQPHPPQSQPHHNSSQSVDHGVDIDARIHNTRSHVCSSATNVVPNACVCLQVRMATSKSVLVTTTGRLNLVDQNALDFSS